MCPQSRPTGPYEVSGWTGDAIRISGAQLFLQYAQVGTSNDPAYNGLRALSSSKPTSRIAASRPLGSAASRTARPEATRSTL